MKYTIGLYLCVISLGLIPACELEEVEIPKEPRVSITFPRSGDFIIDTTFIRFEASDDFGVTRVDLYIDGKKITKDITLYDPYEYFWDVRELEDSTVHEIYATAMDADSNISVSQKINVRIKALTPSNFFTDIMADTLVRLSWRDRSSVETAYQILSAVNDSEFTIMKTLPENTTSVDLPGIYLNTNRYWFKIRAMSGTKKSFELPAQWITPVLLALPIPAVDSAGEERIGISWTKLNQSFPKWYEVELSEGSKPFTKIRTLSGNASAVTIDSIYKTNVGYKFRVRWLSDYNVSPYSPTRTVIIPFSAPGNLTIDPILPYGLELKWKDNSTIEKGFSIQRRSNTEAVFTEVQKVGPNVTSYQDNTMDTAATYMYRITAYTDHNTTPVSAHVNAAFTPDYTVVSSMTAHQGSISSMRFLHLSDILVSAGSDGNVKFLKPFTGEQIGIFKIPGTGVNEISITDDDVNIAAACDDHTVKIYDVASKTLQQTVTGHTQQVTSVDFSSDGSLLLSGSADSTVRLWNSANGNPIRSFTGHTNVVNSVVFHPSNNSIASGGNDYTLRTWDVNSSNQLWSSFDSLQIPKSISYNATGDVIAVGRFGNGSSLRFYSTANGAAIFDFSLYSYNVEDLQYNSDASLIGIATKDGGGLVRVYRTGVHNVYFESPGGIGELKTVAINRDNNYIAIGSNDGRVKIWHWQNFWH